MKTRWRRNIKNDRNGKGSVGEDCHDHCCYCAFTMKLFFNTFLKNPYIILLKCIRTFTPLAAAAAAAVAIQNENEKRGKMVEKTQKNREKNEKKK
ncbi:hypothetical protein POVWA2_043040 [Plasmodium ovale wallikeri]|uniref:Uncharacterized protein n=1 Tax=Plasmodium ovale wallikeri TaxID=864142 RepID=A0A1A8ZDX3_PLAOA|nr:hypothetical protein POVWA2_043040 [Plasmodium ovale wallikeri]